MAKNVTKFAKTQQHVSIQTSCTILANPFTMPMNGKRKSLACVRTLRVLKKPWCNIEISKRQQETTQATHKPKKSKWPCLLQPCAWALWLKLGQGKKETGQKKSKERKKIEHIRGIKKKKFNVILMMRFRVYYREEGDDFLSNLGCMNLMSSKQIHDSKLASFSLMTFIV